MNILYIDHYAGGPSYGMEYRPYYLSREWTKAGHKVTIVGASYSHVRFRNPLTPSKYTVEKLEEINHIWCRTPAYTGNGLSRVKNIFSFVRSLYDHKSWLKEAPDVVIASSTHPLDIYPARKIAQSFKAKLVWEVHDLWPLSPIELGGISRWHPFMLLLQAAENYACRNADAVISILPKTYEHLVEHGMLPEKFTHIPNGIDLEEWISASGNELPATTAQLLADKKKAGKFLVGYAGAHGVANMLDNVIDAAAQRANDNVLFVLVGSGPEKSRLENKAQELGLENVIFVPPVQKAAIPSLLNVMDVLYIGLQKAPLFRFGISPNKIMDYMMAAKPVIAAIEAGNDLVTEACCGITIGAENPETLNNAIDHLRSISKEETRLLGDRGRQYVQNNHTYPVLARKFLEAFH